MSLTACASLISVSLTSRCTNSSKGRVVLIPDRVVVRRCPFSSKVQRLVGSLVAIGWLALDRNTIFGSIILKSLVDQEI
ncbi:hypothetical protein FJ417_26105 [Mesorhizobium sp. B3-1-7]|uniref:hypothetical protein n=1 Tax=Mesorhizobium sp. B3-1-7 TaxID=2589894 RepID=UPI0011289461|nr:hypothetical protein [Mesorhizobium sp. B3-1-7]TPI53417.1 hypothetical protein FJ417_26105 [Mesorhizobium sp. B3-1-7]